MITDVHGIHHVTAYAGDAQKNVDFYAGILGLRLVKKTVNFDDPHTYHLYYGDEGGTPGSIMTFFPRTFQGRRGRPGTGQVTAIHFSIPEKAMAYWIDRLKQYRIDFEGPLSRFDEEEVVTLSDPDGLALGLVSSASDTRPGWDNESIPASNAIRGFHSVGISVEDIVLTAGLMTETLGFRRGQESGNRFRYQAGEGGPGTIVDLLCQPNAPSGQMGVGAVHHVAWRVVDRAAQLQLRQELIQLGYDVTPVMDRVYFHSIYFVEPGRVLFEVATDSPGFAVDEALEDLGTHLMLPSWLEQKRATIEQVLPLIGEPDPKGL